jgi:hypothetical protein
LIDPLQIVAHQNNVGQRGWIDLQSASSGQFSKRLQRINLAKKPEMAPQIIDVTSAAGPGEHRATSPRDVGKKIYDLRGQFCRVLALRFEPDGAAGFQL